MTDWIADNEAGSSVRGKLNALDRPISSGSISSPVVGVTIAIPSDGDCFMLTLHEWKLDASDTAAMLVSTDGGLTFPTTADYYKQRSIVPDNTNMAAGMVSTDFSDTGAYCIDFVTSDPKDSSEADIKITPGSASTYPRIRSLNTCFNEFNQEEANIYATKIVTPLTARITHIKIVPYNNINTPGGENFTTGSWTLTRRV